MEGYDRMSFCIREATIDDAMLVMDFIRQIAKYEKMESEVVNTEERVREVVFKNNAAKVFLGFEDGQAVGFALFFKTYSTFVGEQGIHLEDLFVNPEFRGKGYGKALFDAVARYAAEGNYGRMEWVCLDWNTPAQAFYKKQDARHMQEWQIYRLTSQQLKDRLSK